MATEDWPAFAPPRLIVEPVFIECMTCKVDLRVASAWTVVMCPRCRTYIAIGGVTYGPRS